MSKASPALIGGFVIGAIALIVIGLLVFGGAGWLAHRAKYVAYFPGSVKGLRVGAPVDFRGVTIGQVTDIKVMFDLAEVRAQIPVIIEIDASQIVMTGPMQISTGRQNAERLVKAGFSAQLQSQSLLTGLLFVNLDFRKGAEARLVGGDQPYPEIPTVPSELEQLQQSAGDVASELPGLIKNLNQLLTTVDAELQASKGNFQSIVADVAGVAQDIKAQVPNFERIVANAESATGEVRQTAATLDQVVQTNSDAIGTLIDEWTVTAGSVRRMADQISATIAENRPGLRDFTENGLYEYTGLAQDAQRLVDQFTRVGEQIERNPAGFLFGDRARQGVRPQ
jgi:paraquat-inducible protein B